MKLPGTAGRSAKQIKSASIHAETIQVSEIGIVAVCRIGENRCPGNAIGDYLFGRLVGDEAPSAGHGFARYHGLPTALRVLVTAMGF
jgi:hypothetical protein